MNLSCMLALRTGTAFGVDRHREGCRVGLNGANGPGGNCSLTLLQVGHRWLNFRSRRTGPGGAGPAAGRPWVVTTGVRAGMRSGDLRALEGEMKLRVAPASPAETPKQRAAAAQMPAPERQIQRCPISAGSPWQGAGAPQRPSASLSVRSEDTLRVRADVVSRGYLLIAAGRTRCAAGSPGATPGKVALMQGWADLQEMRLRSGRELPLRSDRHALVHNKATLLANTSVR